MIENADGTRSCQVCGRPLDLYPNVSGIRDALGCLDCQLYWSVEEGQLKAITHVNEVFELPCPVCEKILKKYRSVGGAVGVYGCMSCDMYWTASAEKDLTSFDPWSLRAPSPIEETGGTGLENRFSQN